MNSPIPDFSGLKVQSKIASSDIKENPFEHINNEVVKVNCFLQSILQNLPHASQLAIFEDFSRLLSEANLTVVK